MQQQDFIRARIDAFQDRHGMRHVYLALHAAFPLSLSPDLLYLLRDNFQRDIHGRQLDIPWEAVSDLLLSELCQETGQEAYRMAPETRNYLLERLRKMPRFGEARIQELHEFIAQYYGPLQFSAQPEVRALAEAQLWAAQLQAQPGEAVRTLSRTLYHAQNQSDLALQLRLHYLMEAFPGMGGETGQLQQYTRAVAMDNLGLVADAREAAAGLQVSAGAVAIGGVTFGVKEEWVVAPTEQQQGVVEPELDIATQLRNTLQQLRWMGLYDGRLDEDWRGIEKHIKMRSMVLPGDAHPILMQSAEEWVVYAKGRISAYREQMPQVQVHFENWEKLREYVEPVLDFWRVLQSNSVQAQSLQGQFAFHNILDDQAVETKDLLVIGVDQEWLHSNRYNWIIPAVREAGKPILPVILSPCEWQNSALNEYQKLPKEAGSMEEVREWEDRLREIQFALGRMLREAAEKLTVRQAELAREQSEEGKAKVLEIQQQLRWLGEYDGPSDGEWASIAGFYPDLEGQPFETRVEVAGTRNRQAGGEAKELLVSVDNLGAFADVFEPVLEWWQVRRAEHGFANLDLLNIERAIAQVSETVSNTDIFLIGIEGKLVASFGLEVILSGFADGDPRLVSFYQERCELQEYLVRKLHPFSGFVDSGLTEEVFAEAQSLLGRALRDALRRKRVAPAPEQKPPRSKPLKVYFLYHQADERLGRAFEENAKMLQSEGEIILLENRERFANQGRDPLNATWPLLDQADILVVLLSPALVSDSYTQSMLMGGLTERLESRDLLMVNMEIEDCNASESIFAKAAVYYSFLYGMKQPTLGLEWTLKVANENLREVVAAHLEGKLLEDLEEEEEVEEDGPRVLIVHHGEDFEMAKAVQTIMQENGLTTNEVYRSQIFQDRWQTSGNQDGLIVIEGIQGRKWLNERIEKVNISKKSEQGVGNPVLAAVVGHPKRKDPWPKLPDEWMIVDVQGFEVNPIWTDFARRVEQRHRQRLGTNGMK